MYEYERQDQRSTNLLNTERLPEIWGGLECTINRVGNNYHDQLEISGHYSRDSDIDLIAGLQIKKLRFPILWEKHEPDKSTATNWAWTDKRLKQLQDHGITPIVGLVHHGSGPSYTNLGSNSFATGLASYASKVAARYPWLQYYTPVNEPLTTARFSGLYGHWYPHRTTETAFCTMLLIQLKATVLAMREIRKINPDAKLVQTEDLGKTHAVAPLQYQADFENDRRWITFDLLCGKVDREHPLWDYFIRAGISENSLLFFKENPCPPDVLGLNYYVTSERFLDNRLENYPEHLHGGNWLERYVDTEAIRVDHGQPAGLPVLLDEVEERYRLPIAVTEAHLHCTAEESMRWLKEIWDICSEKVQNGGSILGVTAWSLFGAFGWNKLLTSDNHEYEPGAFDLRGSMEDPRPTIVAKLIKSLAVAGDFSHPALSRKGWWHRQDRFLFSEVSQDDEVLEQGDSPLILLVGAEGSVLRSFEKICGARSLPFEVLVPDDVNNWQEYVDENIALQRYWAVINVADEFDLPCITWLAEKCKINETQFMTFASEKPGEILNANPASIVVTTGTVFHPESADDIIRYAEQTISSNTDQSFSYLPDVTNVSLDLLIREERGVWNLVNDECVMMPLLENALERYHGMFASAGFCES